MSVPGRRPSWAAAVRRAVVTRREMAERYDGVTRRLLDDLGRHRVTLTDPEGDVLRGLLTGLTTPDPDAASEPGDVCVSVTVEGVAGPGWARRQAGRHTKLRFEDGHGQLLTVLPDLIQQGADGDTLVRGRIWL